MGWYREFKARVESRIIENLDGSVYPGLKSAVIGVFQAGQWSFSPSGLPISILTRTLAAKRVLKALPER